MVRRGEHDDLSGLPRAEGSLKPGLALYAVRQSSVRGARGGQLRPATGRTRLCHVRLCWGAAVAQVELELGFREAVDPLPHDVLVLGAEPLQPLPHLEAQQARRREVVHVEELRHRDELVAVQVVERHL